VHNFPLIGLFAAVGGHPFSRGEGGPKGRKWNAGDNLQCATTLRPADDLSLHRPDANTKSRDFRPHSTSASKIGSEEPILATAWALRSPRSAALTVHRTVIHYRRLRFAYPGRSDWRCRAAATNKQIAKLQLICLRAALLCKHFKGADGIQDIKIDPVPAVGIEKPVPVGISL